VRVVATEGGETPAVEASIARTTPDPADADVVITTVVSSDDPRPAAPTPAAPDEDDGAGDDLEWVWADEGGDHLRPPRPPAPEAEPPAPAAPPAPRAEEPAPAPTPATAPASVTPSGLEERLAGLEALPATVENLAKSIRHELQRCAGVLFGHDRALGALAARLDGVEAAAAPPAPVIDLSEPGPPIEERVIAQLEDMNRRLGAMEARVEPLEPLPTVVQALRRAVRASDDLIVGETGAREQALAALASQQAAEAQARDDALRRLVAQDLDRVSGISQAQAKGLSDLAERVAAVETRLAPLDSTPEDIAALSRILRRELDAIVSDNQARDQMLRRALQNEIDQLRATSEAREALAQSLSGRLDALEERTAESATTTDAALASAAGRLGTLEARIEAVDRIGSELEVLRDAVAKEMELIQTSARAHDQLAGELTRRLSALDGRVARLDPVPGEMQSLRTAMLQEAERTMSSLRATDERIGQLAWVPGEFQEARKRIMSLTSGVQSGQDQLRQLEATISSISERLEGVRARLAAAAPPGPPG
jgi:predicted  nucleic acid-binding Zn-ribbon protein